MIQKGRIAMILAAVLTLSSCSVSTAMTMPPETGAVIAALIPAVVGVLKAKNDDGLKTIQCDGFSVRIPKDWSSGAGGGAVAAWPEGSRWFPYMKFRRMKTEKCPQERAEELAEEFLLDFGDLTESGPEIISKKIEGTKRILTGIEGTAVSPDRKNISKRVILTEKAQDGLFEYEAEWSIRPKDNTGTEEALMKAVESAKPDG